MNNGLMWAMANYVHSTPDNKNLAEMSLTRKITINFKEKLKFDFELSLFSYTVHVDLQDKCVETLIEILNKFPPGYKYEKNNNFI